MPCPKSKQNSQYALWVLVDAAGPGDTGTKVTLLCPEVVHIQL